MARMFNPPHPGLTLRDDVLPALGLTVTQAAQQLGVSRVALSHVLNGRAAISPEMALRIEAWLGVKRGGEARLWLAEQSAYDVWQAQERFKTEQMRVQPAPAATDAGSRSRRARRMVRCQAPRRPRVQLEGR
jgi:addiction module HigA family antidote